MEIKVNFNILTIWISTTNNEQRKCLTWDNNSYRICSHPPCTISPTVIQDGNGLNGQCDDGAVTTAAWLYPLLVCSVAAAYVI